MESKKINQLATELTPALSDLTIIGDPTTGISKKITLSQMASLFTGTVEEYANVAAFPLVGVADTIYIALDTNVLYRWNTGTSAYVELSPNIINSLVFSDANGFDGNISLVGSVATLTITTALTTGSVPFIGASGALTQDNANLFFDDTNNRLGINTNAPTTALDVFGSGIIGRINGTSTNNAFLGFASAGTNKWSIGNVQSDHRFRIYNEATTSELVSVLSTGEFGIGIANPTTKFHIDGAASALIANLDANISVAKSLSFRSDNSNRINLEVSGTESGSNAGANFFLRTYTDAGSLLETPFSIVRSTGITTIKSLTLTNALSIANGGTGSTTQNFVDLTTTQSIGGTKTFTSTETTLNFNPQTSLLSGYNYLNFGGGSIMYRNATDLYIGSNAKYGSAGTVVANYTSANGMGLLTMDGGNLRFQANNTSVTAGSAYGVPIRFAINGDGNIGIGNTTALHKVQIGSNSDQNTSIGKSILFLSGNAGNLGYVNEIGFGDVGSINPQSAIGNIITNATAASFGDLYFATRNVTTDTAPTEKMRIASNGLVSVNETYSSANYKFAVKGASHLTGSNNKGLFITDSASFASIVGLNKEISSYNPIEFRASGVDGQLYLNTTGNVLIGSTTDNGYKLAIRAAGNTDTEALFVCTTANGSASHYFFSGINSAMNTADANFWVRRNGTTSRSINAAGTINASGADYAEYMLKAIYDNIEKGDIVGVNINGQLTNIFSDSISFVVKSTDPSYVGGDTWFNVEPPIESDFKTKEEFEIAYEEFKEQREEARQKVDRIAFSGQVPCNVLNAKVGDYIIPINNNGKISGQAITNPTFEQYQISVGKVWKIMEDGRAWIAVKIG